METADCIEGLARLPGGSTAVPFSLIQQGHPVSLPISISIGERSCLVSVEMLMLNNVLGSCFISVEVGGPTFPDSISIVPNTLRSMASWVIDRCLITAGGMGGFVTHGFSNMVDYIITHGLIPTPATILRKIITISTQGHHG